MAFEGGRMSKDNEGNFILKLTTAQARLIKAVCLWELENGDEEASQKAVHLWEVAQRLDVEPDAEYYKLLTEIRDANEKRGAG
jgi:hypothetical protein